MREKAVIETQAAVVDFAEVHAAVVVRAVDPDELLAIGAHAVGATPVKKRIGDVIAHRADASAAVGRQLEARLGGDAVQSAKMHALNPAAPPPTMITSRISEESGMSMMKKPYFRAATERVPCRRPWRAATRGGRAIPRG